MGEGNMRVRGVRGATSVSENTAQAITSAGAELLQAMIGANGILEDDVASVMFTTTPDLTATFPATAGRAVGWSRVALMGGQEMSCDIGLPMTLRILIHWNTIRTLDELVHVYLHGAVSLRPDFHARHQNHLSNQTLSSDQPTQENQP